MKMNKAVYELVKQKCKGKEFQDNDKYTLVKLSDNLFEPMEEKHQKEFFVGKKGTIPSRYNNICSSDMFTYNIFGNSKIKFLKCLGYIKKGVYNIEYEKKYSNLFSSTKSVFDVLLTNNNDAIHLFEVKFTEWISKSKSEISENNLKLKHYSDRKIALSVIDLYKKVIKRDSLRIDNKGLKKYKSKYSPLDTFQIIKHINGLIENRSEFVRKGRKTITLNLLHWCIEESNTNEYKIFSNNVRGSYKILKKNFEEFKTLVYKTFSPYFKEVGIDFKIQLVNFIDFIGVVDFNNNQLQFIKRYQL